MIIVNSLSSEQSLKTSNTGWRTLYASIVNQCNGATANLMLARL
jgi:hypothetical protein